MPSSGSAGTAGADVAARTPLAPIAPVQRTGALPLSVGQEAFWVLERMVPGTPFSNLTGALRLRGPLRVRALASAYGEVVRRHEVLRTAFASGPRGPTQVVGAPSPIELDVHDLRGLPEEDRWQGFVVGAIRHFRPPFDFARGRLLRTALFRLGRGDYVVVHTMPHIVCDSWSFRVLAHELAALYPTYAAGIAPSLSALPIQYADYACWQRTQLDGDAMREQLRYWRGRLAHGDLPRGELPTDSPRPSRDSFRTATCAFVLPAAETAALRAFAVRAGCTLFMVLLSVFEIVLQRFTGHDETRVGTIVAGRAQRELEDLIGLFINTILLRVDLSRDPPLHVAVQRVRDVVLEAYDNQDVPFECVVGDFERASGIERRSLFHVLFLFEHAAPPPQRVGDLIVEALDVKQMVETDLTLTSFDLIVTLREQPDTVSGSLVYKTSLFSAATMAWLSVLFRTVGQALVDDPRRPLSSLPTFVEPAMRR
jgi:hypothetical protein